MKIQLSLSYPFFLLLTLFFLFACEKGDVNPNQDCGIPRESCRDCEWNVFKCKINGEEWCASCEGENIIFGCDPVDCQFYPNDSIRWLNTIAYNDYYTINITSSIFEIDEKCEFLGKSILFNRKMVGECKVFAPDTTFANSVKITSIDHQEQLIEGSFEFQALNECGDTTKVTDGIFKLTYRP
ncbi:MAG: hypothetical protein R2879_10435 [Saprospiraceae bacterium]